MEQQLKTSIQQPTHANGIRKNERLEVVDALRGIALCAIVIIHCLEHYNLYFIPENAPQWLTTIDKGIWQTTWFLLAGKAFSAFSLLFGFSFFIQYDNAQRRGIPFRGRFAWRMLLLVMFSHCTPCSTTAISCSCMPSWDYSSLPYAVVRHGPF